MPAPPTPESPLPPHAVSTPVSSAPRVNVVRPRDSSGRFIPRSGARDNTPDEAADSPRMQNEAGSSSRDGQQIRVDPPDHVVIAGDSEVPREGSEIEGDDDNPNFQRVPGQVSDEHCIVESQVQSLQSSELQLPRRRRRITSQQFERHVRARQSTSSVPLFFQVKQHWHSVRVAWNLLVCLQTMEKGWC